MDRSHAAKNMGKQFLSKRRLEMSDEDHHYPKLQLPVVQARCAGARYEVTAETQKRSGWVQRQEVWRQCEHGELAHFLKTSRSTNFPLGKRGQTPFAFYLFDPGNEAATRSKEQGSDQDRTRVPQIYDQAGDPADEGFEAV